jgi:hypothetical protein
MYNIIFLRIESSDRNLVLFTHPEFNTLKGVNYWQGLGDDTPINEFLKPDDDLTDWVLKRLNLVNEEWTQFGIVCPTYDELIDNIDAAISGYVQHRNTPQQLANALMLLHKHAVDNNLPFIDLRELLK